MSAPDGAYIFLNTGGELKQV